MSRFFAPVVLVLLPACTEDDPDGEKGQASRAVAENRQGEGGEIGERNDPSEGPQPASAAPEEDGEKAPERMRRRAPLGLATPAACGIVDDASPGAFISFPKSQVRRWEVVGRRPTTVEFVGCANAPGETLRYALYHEDDREPTLRGEVELDGVREPWDRFRFEETLWSPGEWRIAVGAHSGEGEGYETMDAVTFLLAEDDDAYEELAPHPDDDAPLENRPHAENDAIVEGFRVGVDIPEDTEAIDASAYEERVGDAAEERPGVRENPLFAALASLPMPPRADSEDVRIRSSERGERLPSVSVHVLVDGYLDDSQRGAWWKIELDRDEDGDWRVSGGRRAILCYRGEAGFTSSHCL